MESDLEILIECYISNLEVFYEKQGSDKAIDGRKLSIGCSELHKATNTKSSKVDLICKKLTASGSLSKLIPIVWGHAFEATTKLITSILLNCIIHEAPASIRSYNNMNSCSPDGIGQILIDVNIFMRQYRRPISIRDLEKSRGNYKFDKIVDFESAHKFYERFRKVNNNLISSEYSELLQRAHVPIIALFEFKSPISRDLKCKINQEYIYQVLGGLEIIKICDIGVFAECRFVVCNAKQLAFNDSYLEFKSGNIDSSGLFMLEKPKFIGAKYFVINGSDTSIHPYDCIVEIEAEMDLWDIINKLVINKDYTTIDCCFIENDEYSSRRLFDNFTSELNNTGCNFSMESIAEYYGRFQAYTGEGVNPISELTNYLYSCNEGKIFGVMYWKMMDHGIAYIDKVNGFIDEHIDDIKDVYDSMCLLKHFSNDRIKMILSEIPCKRGCRKSVVYEEIISQLNK